jgi:hypothetical protein
MEDAKQCRVADDFSTLNLGDRRLRSRATAVLTRATQQPHGRINAVFPDGAEREAAYRFVENNHVEPSQLVAAACDAAMQQRIGDDVLVVVDQTSLSFKDPKRIRGLGRTGADAYTFVTRGLEVMNAMVLAADGRFLGVAGQEWWVRKDEKSPDDDKDRRSSLDRESINWVRAMSSSTTNIRRTVPSARITFVGDRGSDFYGVFMAAERLQTDIIIRSQHDRRLVDGRRLNDVLRNAPLFGRCRRTIRVRRGEFVEEVKAKLNIRVAKVDVVLQAHGGKCGHARLTAVRVVENGKRQSRVSWTLLTTWKVETQRDVEAVLDAYCRRWRIEDFHRTWKRGGCCVEQAQLRSVAALKRWATILAVVATRIERLKTLARTEPDRPARDELSEDEVEALRLISGEPKHWPKDWSLMTIGQATNLIAYLGGWGGRSQGLPGSTILGRGLERVEMAASVVTAIRSRPQ